MRGAVWGEDVGMVVVVAVKGAVRGRGILLVEDEADIGGAY